MYEFHRYLRPILLLLHSFWIPQIITNIVRDSRKPLHPQYIIGMSLTRLAIPLYVFGCPHNFMRIEPDNKWCISLCALVGFQAAILILQHYLGSRCFIPHQVYFLSSSSAGLFTPLDLVWILLVIFHNLFFSHKNVIFGHCICFKTHIQTCTAADYVILR